MDNFSINNQVEDTRYGSVGQVFQETVDNFRKACSSLLSYRRIASYKEYEAAAEEAYTEANPEIIDLMEQYFGIESARDYLIFLDGMYFAK